MQLKEAVFSNTTNGFKSLFSTPFFLYPLYRNTNNSYPANKIFFLGPRREQYALLKRGLCGRHAGWWQKIVRLAAVDQHDGGSGSTRQRDRCCWAQTRTGLNVDAKKLRHKFLRPPVRGLPRSDSHRPFLDAGGQIFMVIRQHERSLRRVCASRGCRGVPPELKDHVGWGYQRVRMCTFAKRQWDSNVGQGWSHVGNVSTRGTRILSARPRLLHVPLHQVRTRGNFLAAFFHFRCPGLLERRQ